MDKSNNNLTSAQKRKVLDAVEIIKNGEVAVLKKIIEFTDVVEENTERVDEMEQKVESAIYKANEAVEIIKQSVEEKLSEVKDGVQGEKGENGIDGKDGKNGKDGKDGKNGKDGKDGKNGVDGLNGLDGKDGSPDTPNQIADKLNTLEEVIDQKVIKGLTKKIADISSNIAHNTVAKEGAKLYTGTSETRVREIIAETPSSGTSFTVGDIDGNPSVSNPTAIKFTNGSVTDNGDGTVSVTTGAGGGGDVSSSVGVSVDSEVAIFDGTGGKTIKRASATGIAKLTSGVLSAITPGTGIETWLATPSSANLASAITDETGSGALVFGTSPTLTTPTLGVASATSINKVAFTAPATGATIVATDGTTTTLSGGTHSGTNTGDQTSIVGITGTKAQFDTAVSDGNIFFDGDSIVNATGTAWRVFYSDGSGVITELALGADGTFLKSNGAAVAPSFATPSGSGDVSKVGTPANNQIGVWTGDGTIEGDANLTWDGTSFNIATAKNFQIAGGTVLADSAGTLTLSGIDAIDATTEATIESAIDTLANLTSIQGRTVTLADAGANAFFGWDDVAGAYENLTSGEAFAILGVTSSAAELNILDGATLTVTELNYVDGVTSAIQTQLDAKLALAGGTMTGNITLGENASIDLDPAGSADGKYTGTAITGTAGATLAFGDLIYLDPTDSRWELTDANAASGADGDARGIIGICVLAAAGDGSATKILLSGVVRADTAFPAMTINAPMYVSETAGDITGTVPTTTDNVIRCVGKALTADELFFNPSSDWATHV